ncbi:thermonuclease family protein [Xanthobacter sp. TB0139]|uniref:thermonuclease family protein n=1 Tax=Xanthobacter sp. TB0139 TaxID=3459178 RepID=UPI00403A71FE
MSPRFRPFLLLVTALALPASPHGAMAEESVSVGPCPISAPATIVPPQLPAEGTALYIKELTENGSLLLTNGQTFLPEGIALPSRLTAEADVVRAARKAMATTFHGQPLHLTHIWADRYGRLNGRATLETGEDATLSLLRAGAGLARPVEIQPPRNQIRRAANLACNQALLATEALARQARSGIWALPRTIVEAQDEVALAAHAGLFTLVEGRVQAVGVTRNRIYVNFGPRWSEDFTIMLARKDFATIFGNNLDPAMLRGTFMHVRGVVQEEGGPAIFIHKAENVAWWTPSDEERDSK